MHSDPSLKMVYQVSLLGQHAHVHVACSILMLTGSFLAVLGVQQWPSMTLINKRPNIRQGHLGRHTQGTSYEPGQWLKKQRLISFYIAIMMQLHGFCGRLASIVPVIH